MIINNNNRVCYSIQQLIVSQFGLLHDIEFAISENETKTKPMITRNPTKTARKSTTSVQWARYYWRIQDSTLGPHPSLPPFPLSTSFPLLSLSSLLPFHPPFSPFPPSILPFPPLPPLRSRTRDPLDCG